MSDTTEIADTQLAPGVVTNPGRRGGKPTISGTRVTVEDVISRVAAGWTIEDILHAFPHLTREQVLNALAYAADMVHHGPWPQVSENQSGPAWDTDEDAWDSGPLL